MRALDTIDICTCSYGYTSIEWVGAKDDCEGENEPAKVCTVTHQPPNNHMTNESQPNHGRVVSRGSFQGLQRQSPSTSSTTQSPWIHLLCFLFPIRNHTTQSISARSYLAPLLPALRGPPNMILSNANNMAIRLPVPSECLTLTTNAPYCVLSTPHSHHMTKKQGMHSHKYG